MVDRDTYKTKLCAHYRRGHCRFNFCKFAHGSAELRRPFTGDRGSVELRGRLHRNRSPLRNSPDRRDGKARQTSPGDSSPEKRMSVHDRNVRKRTRWDVRGDGTIDQIEDTDKMQIDDQLREAYAEIRRLEDDKQRLQMYLEDKDKEADSLTFEIHELEMQLSEEKEEGKRFTTKAKKFIEAHNRHLRLQDELKRSEAQLQNLVEHIEGNEDDPNIKALSDDEEQLNSSSRRLRSRVEVRETSPQVQRQR